RQASEVTGTPASAAGTPRRRRSDHVHLIGRRWWRQRLLLRRRRHLRRPRPRPLGPLLADLAPPRPLGAGNLVIAPITGNLLIAPITRNLAVPLATGSPMVAPVSPAAL